MLTTIPAVLFVDKFGRRPILIFGLIFTTISMCLLAWCFYHGTTTVELKYLAVASVLLFIFGFAISLGPIMWIICAEIFPLEGRDFGVMVTTMTNWICNAIISNYTLTVIAKIHDFGIFWAFSIIGLISLLFIYRIVPETKGVSLEQIENNLMSGKRLRWLGR